MILKLASASSKATGFVPKAINALGLKSVSKKLAKNPYLVDKIKNASLVGTIALGDGALKVVNRDPHESRVHAFAHGAAEGAFAGGLIAGADQLVDTLVHHGSKNLNIFGR